MIRPLIAIIAIAVLAPIAPPLTAQGNADIVGTWEMTTNSPEGDRTNTMVVTSEGGKLKGVAKSERGERAYDSVEVKGSDITIVLTIDYNGMAMVITYSGKIDKAAMKGDADFGGLATGTWSAVKK
jgi:hypothetical protein